MNCYGTEWANCKGQKRNFTGAKKKVSWYFFDRISLNRLKIDIYVPN